MDNRYSFVGNMMDKGNPLHIYCRLMDCGMDKDYATRLCEIYEEVLYKPINKFFLKPLHKIETHFRDVDL